MQRGAHHTSIDIASGIGCSCGGTEHIQGTGIFLADFTPTDRHGVTHARRFYSQFMHAHNDSGDIIRATILIGSFNKVIDAFLGN